MADHTPLLLLNLADRIDQFPHAAMTQKLVEAQALNVAEAMYGPGAYSEQIEHHLLTQVPPIRPGDTRGEYAARLRLMATGAAV
ncbi:hypothetical protein ACFXGT_08165 [Streptomyces sp. NPDC059352]|uniref:hypothetical protein n=1 Tax=Streptomyces sp. NPDC059352 TaxID=3346810 RepID=UPI0036A1BC50